MERTPFSFPFEPYPAQLRLMNAIHECISSSAIGCFESPTGTGKSLSVICASFSWLQEHERDVLQRTSNSTVSQVSEAGADNWLSQYVESYEQQRSDGSSRFNEAKSFYEEVLQRIKRSLGKRDVSKGLTPDLFQSKHQKSANSMQQSNEISQPAFDEDLIVDHESEDEESDEEPNAWEILQLPRIIYCSRTHSQLAQFTQEMHKTRFGHVRCVTLGGRRNFCINPTVANAGSDMAVTEKCLELLNSKQSTKTASSGDSAVKKQRLRTAQDKSCSCKNSSRETQLSYQILAHVRDIEDVVSLGRAHDSDGTCPFYASKKAVKYAQVVCLPYNMLLNEQFREQSGLSLRNSVVIIDEAHNLVDALHSTFSAEVTLRQVQQSLQAVKQYVDSYCSRLSPHTMYHLNLLQMLFKKLQTFLMKQQHQLQQVSWTANEILVRCGVEHVNLFELQRFLRRSHVVSRIAHHHQRRASGADTIGMARSALQTTVDVLQCLSRRDSEGRVFLSLVPSTATPSSTPPDSTATSPAPSEVLLRYQLLSVTHCFREVVQQARSVVLLGGTMQPFSYFTSSVFRDVPESRLRLFACGHIIPQEQLLTVVMSHGVSTSTSAAPQTLDFTHEHRMAMRTTTALAEVLDLLLRQIPHGCVVFFPSYKYLALLVSRWRSDGTWSRLNHLKPIFVEQQQQATLQTQSTTSDAAVAVPWERLWEQYRHSAEANRKGAALFSVMGGRLSEGINFSDNLARGVVVVGLPFPDTRDIIMQEKVQSATLQDPVNGPRLPELLCMRSVNQAIGRAIRHRGDFCSIFLLDQRYAQPRIQQQLPGWIRSSLRPEYSSGAPVSPAVLSMDLQQFFERNYALWTSSK